VVSILRSIGRQGLVRFLRDKLLNQRLVVLPNVLHTTDSGQFEEDWLFPSTVSFHIRNRNSLHFFTPRQAFYFTNSCSNENPSEHRHLLRRERRRLKYFLLSIPRSGVCLITELRVAVTQYLSLSGEGRLSGTSLAVADTRILRIGAHCSPRTGGLQTVETTEVSQRIRRDEKAAEMRCLGEIAWWGGCARPRPTRAVMLENPRS
jgi:hypothetical protein